MHIADDIQSELKAVAPLLCGIPKSIPFIVPEGYFEDLESETLVAVGMRDKADARIDVRNIPLQVPLDYFENLPTQILSRVASEASTNQHGSRLHSMNMRWWLAAASVILIAVASISVLRKQPVKHAMAHNAIDTTYLLLESAAGLSDAAVLNLYALDQTSSAEDSSLNQYLIEASGIDAEFVYSL